MGSFEGHLLPGASFLLWGLLWTFNIIRRAMMCRDCRIKFFNTITYPLPRHGRCVKWSLEAALKMFLTSIGMTIELLASTDFGKAGRIVFVRDIQHTSMYGFFFLSGIIDILQAYNKVPPKTDYMAMALAFLGEGMLFMHHANGVEILSSHLHKLLLYVIISNVILILLESSNEGCLLLALARAYSVILQGTWFIHLGLILYPPRFTGLEHWDDNTQDSVIVATMYFTWHFCGVFILMSLMTVLALYSNKNCSKPSADDYYHEMPEDMKDRELLMESSSRIFDLQEVSPDDCNPFERNEENE